MGYQHVQLEFSVSKKDLIKLFMDNLNLSLKTKTGEEIKLDSLFAHENGFDEDAGFSHSFETYVVEGEGDEEMHTRAFVSVVSKDNKTFTGTISYNRHNGDNVSE
jgi:hypothetical protein